MNIRGINMREDDIEKLSRILGIDKEKLREMSEKLKLDSVSIEEAKTDIIDKISFMIDHQIRMSSSAAEVEVNTLSDDLISKIATLNIKALIMWLTLPATRDLILLNVRNRLSRS